MKALKGYISSLFDKEFVPTGLKTVLLVPLLLQSGDSWKLRSQGVYKKRLPSR